MSLLCNHRKCCKLLQSLRFGVDVQGRVEMRRLRAWVACGLLWVCVSVLSIGLSAQSFQGGLRGVVKDPQAVIPGATVTLVNEQNGVSRETVTNGVGEYSFPAIEPSTYTVRAAVQGITSVERKGVRI